MVYDKSVVRLLQVYGGNPVHVTPTVILKIYERIFGCLPDDCIRNPSCQADDIENVAAILLVLQEDVLKIDLGHIDSHKVVHGDPISVEYLLEILAGYVEYILEDDPDDTQNISYLTDDAVTPQKINQTFTPTKEILAESPIRSILQFDSDEESEPIHLDEETKNTSAFMMGYNEGLAGTPDVDNVTMNGQTSLLQRLNKLPHLSDALKKNGVDISDYTVTESEATELYNDTDELLKSDNQNDTNDLLAGSMSEIGSCVAQSTPFPSKLHTDAAVQHDSLVPKTPEQKLDETIKSRLLYLLEQSGNTKIKKRHVRFDVPDSLSGSFNESRDTNNVTEKERQDYEMDKKILEDELKEKIDELMREKKKLRELAIKKTTPKLMKKTTPIFKKSSNGKSPSNSKRTPYKSPGSKPTSGPIIQDYLLPQMLDEFPYLHVSPQTARVLWNKQVKQISALTQSDVSKTILIKKHLKEEEKRQELLLNLMKKELAFVNRVNNEKALKDEKRLLKAKLLEKKLTTARVRKYHQDYCKRTKARMCNKNYKEEVMFKQLFEKGLKIQKEKLLEARKMEKEENEIARLKHEKDVTELEKYYTDQFDLMSSEMDEEQNEKLILDEEQRLRINKQKLSQRQKMKEEIENIQENLVRSDEHIHYKELDFDRALNNLR